MVRAVLLYGSETWVISLPIWSTLGGFHHRVSHILMGWQPRWVLDGRWVYPPLEEVTEEAGLQEVDTYVARHHKTVTQYIATRSIMYLCLVEYPRPGTRFSKQ